jgi:hypothetical protein
MKNNFSSVGRALFLSFFVLCIYTVQAIAAKDQDFKVLSSSANHLTIEFIPQQWRIETRNEAGEVFQLFSFDHAKTEGETGAPQIPLRIITIGVPLNASLTFQVLETDYETLQNVRILPMPEVKREDLGYSTLYNAGQEIYQSREPWPAKIASIEEPSFFRSQRIAQIKLRPLQFLPAEQIVRRYKRIVLEIDFSNGEVVAEQTGSVATDDSWYHDLLLNYQQARAWRKHEARTLYKATRRTFEGDNWYKLIIHGDGKGGKEGMYKVDGATLAKAGVPTGSIDPTTIQVFNNGGRELPQEATAQRPDSLIEIPIIVVGGEDGRLDAGDYILFYGISLEGFYYEASTQSYRHYINHFSFDNIYWLSYGRQPGKRIQEEISLPTAGMSQESSFLDCAFLEEERTNIYHSGMDWFGFELAAEKNSFSSTFSLPGAIPQGAARFRFQVATATSGNHYFKMYANGNTLGEASQSGSSTSYALKETSLTASGVMLDGNNAIQIDYTSTSDIAFSYVDWIELQFNRAFHASGDQLLFNGANRDGSALYKIDSFSGSNIDVYDITKFNDVKKIANTVVANNAVSFADETSSVLPKRYIALVSTAYKSISSIEKHESSDLRRARTVDYIIITHPDFYQQAMALESLRENWNSQDRLETEVVKVTDIFDEFGWGIRDIAAIRDFLAYAQKNWGNPRYVLLLGDGHYDYKDIRGSGTTNFIPPWESDDRYEDTTRTSDDWFTYTLGRSARMQMAIGRLPVQTPDEAQNIVEKIIQYETKPDLGEWRKTLTIVGDDELGVGGNGNETFHTQQAEALAEYHVPNLLNVDKIDLIEYPAVRTASVSGVTKPAAKEALLEQINRGTLIVNFIGHGNDEQWAHEQVLYGSTDFDRIQNQDRLAFWIAATCEFALWDQPSKQSLAERILSVRGRGAVAMLSSARLAYSGPNAEYNYDFYDELFKNYDATGVTARLGDANLLAKRSTGDTSNNEKYNIFGDPAMRLGTPRYRAVIDGIQPDSIQALRKVKITGHIDRDQALWQDFNGKVLVRVVDSRKQKTYETASGSRIQYVQEGNSLFRGVVAANAGIFEVEFIVPKDISYGGTDGQVSLYFWNDNEDGTGIRKNLIVGGTAVDLVDHEGPAIQLHFGQSDFAPGDYTSDNPVLHLDISDSLSGVNIAGDIGHQIQMILDNDQADAKDLTEFFEYKQGSYTTGTLQYPIYQISEGRHDLQVKAWDNSNNSSTAETYFVVVADSILRVRDLLTYPNPMSDYTSFSFELSQDAEISLKIYSVAGRLLRNFEPVQGEIGFNVFPERWDGTDQDGDHLANGVYLYKLKAKGKDGDKIVEAEKIGKLIIAR